MQPGPQPSDDDIRPRRPIVPILGSVVALILILVLGLMANRLSEIEAQMSYSPPMGLDPGAAMPADVAARGHAVYVPAYSHIYARGGGAVQLDVILSARNTDPEHPIRLDHVGYFGTDGELIRELAAEPLVLGPLQTATYLVAGRDFRAGSGANFMVEWSAQEAINGPIFEAVMLGPDEGISFTSRGVPVERR
jgi:hypothetical protein